MFKTYNFFVGILAYVSAGGESFEEFCFRICAPCSGIDNTFGCDCSLEPKCEVPELPTPESP